MEENLTPTDGQQNQPEDKKPKTGRNRLKIILFGLVALVIVAVVAVYLYRPIFEDFLSGAKLEQVRLMRIERQKVERQALLDDLRNEKNSLERLRKALSAQVEVEVETPDVDLDKYGPQLRAEYEKVLAARVDRQRRIKLADESVFKELITLTQTELQQIKDNVPTVQNADFDDFKKAYREIESLRPMISIDISQVSEPEQPLLRRLMTLEVEKKLAALGLNSDIYRQLTTKYQQQIAGFLSEEKR